MKMGLECIPCFLRQACEAVSMVSDDHTSRERIIRQVIFRLANESFDKTPPAVGADIHRIVRRLSGNSDPYREIKRDSNALAGELMPSLRARINHGPDPFETAVRVAIAGNIIDCGQGNHISKHKIEQAISHCLNHPLNNDRLNELRTQIATADHILYLGDNAGEIFFDRLLLEHLEAAPITFAVRGGPTINDALTDDARLAGLDSLVTVIDNGSDVPGTIVKECSPEFQRHFAQADLIIAKGQGNYETLSDEKKTIFFLLKAKCPVIVKDIGCEQGDMVIARNN